MILKGTNIPFKIHEAPDGSMNYPAASSGVSTASLWCHSGLDLESSVLFWTPAFAGVTKDAASGGELNPEGLSIDTKAAYRIAFQYSRNKEIKNSQSAIPGTRLRVPKSKILLIHLGGLGDTCLSESTFLSLSRHFKGNIEALGYTRFLSLFERYFAKIHRIESAKWLHLFSDGPPDIAYERIIFIGKDREGGLRERWQALSKEQLIFIEMYPDSAHSVERRAYRENLSAKTYPLNANNLHVEDYQLAQLAQYGIEAIKKEVEPKPIRRVILYPETGFRKKKWAPENFFELYWLLKSKGIDAYILESLGMKLDLKEKIAFEELTEVQTFFQDGGIFVSNDSGVAHLAGACGLYNITIFADFDPSIWHPRGKGITLKQGSDSITVPLIESKILGIMKTDSRCRMYDTL